MVECHVPLSFIRRSFHQDSCYPAFTEWKDAMNGVNFVPDARRYGKINTSYLSFWVEEVGSITYKRTGWGIFEMYIRTSAYSNHVYECLCGLNGPHFFLINVEMDKMGNPNYDRLDWFGVKIKKFLTPVLMAMNYPGYQEAMDNVFDPLIPYFEWSPDASKLPTTSLH